MSICSFVEIDKQKEQLYLRLLKAVSRLSSLFSESETPLIHYRIAENIFCKSFEAKNLSRSDTAYDAKYGNSLGVGLKTFICDSHMSTEKIAEFNTLSNELIKLEGKELAIRLAEYRNERIDLANRLYDIDRGIYHIVARKHGKLILFETDYDKIQVDKIKDIKIKKSSLSFFDGSNKYSYNFSKSTLYRKFYIPENAYSLDVEILRDPYDLLLEVFQEKDTLSLNTKDKKAIGQDFVVLPLYGYKDNSKFVFEHSGLNQWNANGRKRDINEMYIPIPADIHKKHPNFFPNRGTSFDLKIPTGEIFRAKLCQQNSKALMTDPNKALSDWLLRKVLKLNFGELATIEKLLILGFDSVFIFKTSENKYQIDIATVDSYENFINQNNI